MLSHLFFSISNFYLMMRYAFLLILSLLPFFRAQAGVPTLHDLQQQFVDLNFGMFIHFNIPTFAPDDWPDPDLPASAFAPDSLDCTQWAKAAKSAHMTYGCLTTKHHSGFCLWNTKTTDYNVMNSPLHRDVVREYVDAFRKEGLKVMLYFSILDTHHRLRPHMVTREKIDMVKAQLHELLTGYGPITALIIDGWDAPWSRLSYDSVPFKEIYDYIKSLQPQCLVMDLNAAKYPREALFYTDIKSYEQGAGQHISTTDNTLPALACLPLQRTWFWKTSMPTDTLKSPEWIVRENIVPYNTKAHCNFILNVAPNRHGLMDANALAALKEIGRLYKPVPSVPLPACDAPITEYNIAKGQPAESSWSWDCNLMDFANDDDFTTDWESNVLVKNPFWQVQLDASRPIDLVAITQMEAGVLQSYRLSYQDKAGQWHVLFDGQAPSQNRVLEHRFAPVAACALRLDFTGYNGQVKLAEVGAYSAVPAK